MFEPDETWITDELSRIKTQGLSRKLLVVDGVGGKFTDPQGRVCLNFSSNDYLNLARNETLAKANQFGITTWGTASAASRLVCGTLPPHSSLELEMTQYLRAERMLLLSSGYLANLAMLSGFISEGDEVIADRLIHASLVDGLMLTGCRFHRYHHLDLNHLEQLLEKRSQLIGKKKLLVLTESIFSMDGDCAPLAEIVDLAERYGAYVAVDEAHALGVFGPCGSGVCSELDLTDRVYLRTGTLSKAYASYGGIIASSKNFIELLTQKSRPFIYNTSLPPAVVCAARASLSLLVEHPQWGIELRKRAAFFAKCLQSHGLNCQDATSQIVPLIIGDNHVAVELADRLCENNIFARAFRAPTVPEGTARIRFSITLAHDYEDLKNAAELIAFSAKGM